MSERRASEGQLNYIMSLIRGRIIEAKMVGEVMEATSKIGVVIPHMWQTDLPLADWQKTLDFKEAQAVLRVLVSLPEPEVKPTLMLSIAQRAKIWATMKDKGISTHTIHTMKKSLNAQYVMPHVARAHWEDKVWDWINGLSKQEATEVIDFLEQYDMV